MRNRPLTSLGTSSAIALEVTVATDARGVTSAATAARAAINPYRIGISSRAANGSVKPHPQRALRSEGEEMSIVGAIVTKSCRHGPIWQGPFEMPCGREPQPWLIRGLRGCAAARRSAPDF